MCTGLWWTMNVSDVEGASERDTVCIDGVHMVASVRTHFLHVSFSS